ncbi:MAG: hypothetical protein GX785_19065 [Armatimonadetes bacterium]|jgi:hypothetical protein|nr:hypothetical protein [Armatimonadota bacterium]
MHKGVVLTALTLMACLPVAARADVQPAQLYDTGTARDLGMGGAVTAVADDLCMVLWNPAAAALLEGRRIIYSDSFRTTPKSLRFVSYGQSDEGDFTGALSYLRVDSDTYSTKENTAMYSMGHALSDRLIAGANVKYSRYERLGGAKEAFNVDLGLLYGLTDTTALGLAVLNVNEPRIMDEQVITPTYTAPAARAPRLINVGFAMKLHPQVAPGMLGIARRTYRTRVTFDLFDATDEIRRQLRFGVEHHLDRRWVARAGLLRSTPTFGLGYRGQGYTLNGAVLVGREGERATESVASISADF